MELQRILHPDGRLFITIHDERSIELLETTYASSRLTKLIAGYQAWRERGTDFDQIVIGRDRRSSIFYRRDFFIRHVAPAWDVVSAIPDCHDYQTGLVLARPDRQDHPGTQNPTVTATIDQEQAEELPR